MSDQHPAARAAAAITSPDTVMSHIYSTTAILGAFMGYLPDVAAAFAAVWYAIVIWESRTVQGLLDRRRHHGETEKPGPDESRG